MSDETQNVALFQQAYRRWADSKGDSADHWLSIVDERIIFGSLVEGAPSVPYLKTYQSRDELSHISLVSSATGK